MPIELANPISERASALRRSLVPGLVESARFNRRRGAASVRLFEVATVFWAKPADYRKAMQRVYSTSFIELPIVTSP